MQVLVTIHSTSTVDEEQQPIEVMCSGTLQQHNETVTLVYEEALTEGELFDTTLTAVNGEYVTLERSGPLNGTCMRIEQNKRHLCHYETGFGTMMLGLYGEQIHTDITAHGGNIRLVYALDIDGESLGKNTVEISVRPKEMTCGAPLQ